MKTKTETTEQSQQAELTKEQKDALADQFFARLFSDKTRDRRMEAMHRLDAQLSAFDD